MVTLIQVILITVILWIGVWFAAKKAGVPTIDRVSAQLISMGITTVWLASSVILGKMCFFCAAPDRFPRIPIVLGIFFIIGAGIFLAPLTQRVFNAIPSWLIAFQFFRIIGINFLILFSEGKLPALFAIPIGYGDVLIGLTAPLVAYWYHKRKSWARGLAIGFNIVGVLDIAFSGTIVVFSQSSTIQWLHLNPSTDIVTEFPIILEAVYGMPTVVFVHLYSLYYLFTHRHVSENR